MERSIGKRATERALRDEVKELKRVEESLRASEEEYRATFDQAAIGVAHIGLDGRYLRVNKHLCRITGYTAEELTALNNQDITHAADRLPNARLVCRLLKSDIPTYAIEKRYVRKDGSIVWVKATVSLLRHPSGDPKHFISVVEDIDGRKRTELALRKLTAAVEQGPSAVIITDTTGSIEYVNPRFTELTGYTPEEALGRNPRMLRSGRTPEEEYRRLWRTISSGETWHGRFCNRRKDGECYWESASIAPITDESGAITHYVAVKQDITELKRAEEDRERLLAQLDAVVTSIPDAVVIYNTGGDIVRMNATALEILGYSSEVRGLSLADRVAFAKPETPEGKALSPEEAPAGRALRGETISGMVMRTGSPDRKRCLMVGAAPLRTPDGLQFGAVVALSDITALHDLQQLQKEYVALVSHDLRAPLTGIMGYADLLRSQLAAEGRKQDAQLAASVVRNARRMNTMIRELADSAMLEQGGMDVKLRPNDLAALVRDTVNVICNPEERARIVLEADSALPPVMIDMERIERAFTNLLTNALKYSPPTSPVAVRIAPLGDGVAVSVTDQGIGIPAEDIPRLFQRFFRSKTARRHEGLGLGLYIARLIAEAHDGRLEVESVAGQGSTFRLVLPLGTSQGAA